MREFIRDGVCWQVRESSWGPPGPRSPRCLIFDSDTVVRRVWVYPEHWEQLDDTRLWELMCGVAHVVTPPTPPHAIAWIDERKPEALQQETIASARSLLAHVALLRETNDQLRQEHRVLLDGCRKHRDEMRGAVETYAAMMRSEGVAPEQAIVRIKTAVTAGVGPASAADDPDAQTMMRDAVSWGIAAYYAA
jgi:hypothetical protein